MARKHKNWLKAYMDHTRYSESPDLFHFWTGVGTIAGALQRKVWIDQRHFQWTPNFYIILVAPPGVVSKSTSMGIGMDMLAQVEGVHLGPDSTTWQALAKAFGDAHTLVPFTEAEDIMEQEFRPMSCITCAISELGTFLRPNDMELINVLTDLWDGKLRPWKHSTKTQGDTEIENPWINFIGCTTPSWLGDNFSESMVGGGLVSRIVFVYAEAKRHFVAYPSEQIDHEEFAQSQADLVHDLQLIADIKGDYTLTPDAKVWGTQWYEKHWDEKPLHLSSARFGGYKSRKQTHIHKLAMVVAASQRDERIITLEDLQTSERFITALEADMIKVFESIGVEDVAKKAHEILAVIRAYGEVDRKTLYRHVHNIMTIKTFDEALYAAEVAGLVKSMNKGGIAWYSTPSQQPKAPATNVSPTKQTGTS